MGIKMKKIIILIALAISFAATAFADIDLIANPTSDKDVAALKQLQQQPAVLSAKAVFSGSEKKILKEMKRFLLAESIKLKVKNERSLNELKTWVSKNKLSINISPNAIAVFLDTGGDQPQPFENLQWGLKNTGQSQEISYSYQKVLNIPGVAGEDIGFDGAPPEKINPDHKIRVAILDTGINFNHPNLQSAIFKNTKECEAKAAYEKCLLDAGDILSTVTEDDCNKQWLNADSDGNGYPLDCSGWNVVANDTRRSAEDQEKGVWGKNDATDDLGHGSFVAGIIAGVVNGEGIRGVSQGVEIVPVKVIGESPNDPIKPQMVDVDVPSPLEGSHTWKQGFADIIARGLLYAIRINAQIINMSLAWPEAVDSELMQEMVKIAREKGITIVASAGNDSTWARTMPCQYPGTVCVAAHGPDGALAYFSNYGSSVDIAAPGIRILSTWYDDIDSFGNFYDKQGYRYKNGTSFSSPFVVGMFARLMNAGFTVQEAYARLILSARPHKPSLLSGKTSFAEKYTRSGNADLAAAFKISQQPLILPVEKAAIPTGWDLSTGKGIPVEVLFKNYWGDAGTVSISADIVSDGRSSKHAHLTGNNWQINSWKSNQEQPLKFELVVDDLDISEEVAIEFTIKANGFDTRKTRIMLDLGVPVTDALRIPGLVTIPIKGLKDDPQQPDLRSIGASDGRNDQEYMIVKEDSNKKTALIQLLTNESSKNEYSVVANANVDIPEGEEVQIGQIVRVDVNQDGKSEYVLIYPYRKKGARFMTFQFFNKELAPLDVSSIGGQNNRLDYYAETAPIFGQTRWFRVNDKKGNKWLVPAWYGVGRNPELERTEATKVNPWKINRGEAENLQELCLFLDGDYTVDEAGGKICRLGAKKPPEGTTHQERCENFSGGRWTGDTKDDNTTDPNNGICQFSEAGFPRFYYISPEGLRSIPNYKDSKGQEYYYVSLLKQNAKQEASGLVPVLLARMVDDYGYIVEYLLGVLDGTELKDIIPLSSVPGYQFRNFFNGKISDAISLNPVFTRNATVFNTFTSRGGQVSTVLQDQPSRKFTEFKTVPGLLTDSLVMISGVFLGSQREGVFSMGHYDFQYHDMTRGETVGTSARRYTYLPAEVYQMQFFPVVIGDSRGGTLNDRLPGIYVPLDYGSLKGMQIIVPSYAPDGKLEGLVRPARYRLEAGDGCEALPNLIPADRDNPDQVVFFCGDKFLRVPLKY